MKVQLGLKKIDIATLLNPSVIKTNSSYTDKSRNFLVKLNLGKTVLLKERPYFSFSILTLCEKVSKFFGRRDVGFKKAALPGERSHCPSRYPSHHSIVDIIIQGNLHQIKSVALNFGVKSNTFIHRAWFAEVGCKLI